MEKYLRPVASGIKILMLLYLVAWTELGLDFQGSSTRLAANERGKKGARQSWLGSFNPNLNSNPIRLHIMQK